MAFASTIQELREAGFAVLARTHKGPVDSLTVSAPFPFWYYVNERASSPDSVMASLTEAPGTNGLYAVTFFANQGDTSPLGLSFLNRREAQALRNSHKVYTDAVRAAEAARTTFMWHVE